MKKEEPLYEKGELVNYYWLRSLNKESNEVRLARVRRVSYRDFEYQYLIWDDKDRMLATWVTKDYLAKIERDDKLDWV